MPHSSQTQSLRTRQTKSHYRLLVILQMWHNWSVCGFGWKRIQMNKYNKVTIFNFYHKMLMLSKRFVCLLWKQSPARLTDTVDMYTKFDYVFEETMDTHFRKCSRLFTKNRRNHKQQHTGKQIILSALSDMKQHTWIQRNMEWFVTYFV